MNISFVYPTFLFALVLIAIPIIVHLFDFRRFKKVFFTNVAFLKELREETTSTSRLKHLLVLLSRILAISFLVLAFAQPYIPVGESGKLAATRMVSVFVDNSFSMEAVSKEGTLLDVARTRAARVASAFRPSDRFQLVTNDFDPTHQRFVSREEFLAMVQEIKPSPFSRHLSEVTKRQKDLLQTGSADEKLSFILSDFQTGMVDATELRSDSTITTYLMPIEAEEVSNAYVDSVWLVSPVLKKGEPVHFTARIRNAGELDLESVPVSLVVSGSKRSVATADVEHGSYADVELSYTPDRTGWVQGHVEITDNPVVFDDSYFISFEVTEKLNVLCITGGGENDYLNALFGSDPFFNYAEQDILKLDYSGLGSNDMVVVSEIRSLPSGLTAALNLFTEKGGTVVFIPDSAVELQSASAFLTSLGAPPLDRLVDSEEMTVSLALEDPVFTGVFSNPPKTGEQSDFPKVRRYFATQGGSGAAEILMKLRSGNPLLARYSSGKGSIYLFAVPFSGSFSNLPRHAVFVPVMYRMALLSRNHDALAFVLGGEQSVNITEVSLTGDPVFHLKKQGADFDIIPSVRSTGSGVRLGFSGQVTEAGNYELVHEGSQVRSLSFNYNRDESLLKFYDAGALDEIAEAGKLPSFKTFDANKADIASGVSAFSSGISLWKYCIILVLVFLLTEILLLKFWKR